MNARCDISITGGVIRASGVPRGDVYICDGVNFCVGYVLIGLMKLGILVSENVMLCLM